MQLASYLTYLAGSDLRLVIYFLLGGAVTALTAYFASQGRGMLSAFITTLPLLTVFSFLLIYAEGGSKTVEEYAKSLLIFTPPWLCYVFNRSPGSQSNRNSQEPEPGGPSLRDPIRPPAKNAARHKTVK